MKIRLRARYVEGILYDWIEDRGGGSVRKLSHRLLTSVREGSHSYAGTVSDLNVFLASKTIVDLGVVCDWRSGTYRLAIIKRL